MEENEGKPFDAYEIIMGALKESLAGELEDGEQIIYSSRIGEIGIRQEDGTAIEFSALSDEHRNAIKIVTIIATRMCILNPYFGVDILRLTLGVVIIDELGQQRSFRCGWMLFKETG